jgi:hypothetical protein
MVVNFRVPKKMEKLLPCVVSVKFLKQSSAAGSCLAFIKFLEKFCGETSWITATSQIGKEVEGKIETELTERLQNWAAVTIIRTNEFIGSVV